MINRTWLAAGIVVGLTAGFGARVLNGENATVASSSDVRAVEAASARPWMHPEIAVVVKVPAKSERGVLANSEGATPGVWMHPEIAVVVKVPAKANEDTLVSSAEATAGVWMHPEIAVVVKVPAKAEAALALGEENSEAASRTPARPWQAEDGNAVFPGRHLRHPRWLDDSDFGSRFRGRSADPAGVDAEGGRGNADGEQPLVPGAGPRRSAAQDHAPRAA